MKTTLLKRMTIFVLAAMIAAPTTLFAGDKKPADDKKAADQPAASAPLPKGELKDDENPLLIGKRNINHGILPNFYSLEKEVKLG